MKRLLLAGALLIAMLTQSGCIVIGYSSGGGWFIWPGGLGLIILMVVLYLLFGHRR
jgi:hypothetical protein